MSQELIAFIATLNTRSQVVIRGLAALQALRTTIQEATRVLGVGVYLDQHSDPALADYLGVAGLSAAEDALKGAAVGLVLGVLFGAPREGALLGAALGVSVGVARGLHQVSAGWRVQVFHDAPGEPTAIVTPA